MLYEKIDVVSTHDGDTTTLKIDVFMNRYFFTGPVRLLGVNAPEMNDPDPEIRLRAIRSRDFLSRTLGTRKRLRVECVTDDKYGRPLVKIWVWNSTKREWRDVNRMIIDAGHGKPIAKLKQLNQEKPLPAGAILGGIMGE